MRSSDGVRRHAGYAAAAASITFVTSARSESGTWAMSSPVVGLITSCHSVAVESCHSPLKKLATFVIGGAIVGVTLTLFQQKELRCDGFGHNLFSRDGRQGQIGRASCRERV